MSKKGLWSMPWIWLKRVSNTKKGLWSIRWIWLKRASKYVCVASDQKGPLIYALKKQISDLQTEENKAIRFTVNAKKCTAIHSLRGETGASLQITRDMKTKILFFRHILSKVHTTLSQGWGQVQLTKYSSTPSTPNIYQVQVLVKYSFF